MSYREFFANATAWPPFEFQVKFRERLNGRLILKAPTGLGKTQTVLVAWLYGRVTQPAVTPRRLIWCLPGRALTEQVAREAETCIDRLVRLGLIGRIRVCRLLGGSADNDLTLALDEAAILIGTQDLLLSRALNRGYARNPFRWPIDFGLLNNDCMWVLDEVQLLGDGLATSTQLAAFREKFGVFGRTPSCWISATLDPAWLQTVDFGDGAALIEPDEADLENEIVRQRIGAEKRIERASEACRLPGGEAAFVATEHRPGTLTLVVANTVRRAVEIRRELEGKTKAEVRLLHSRFRAAERREHAEAVFGTLPPEGRILVATQVVEAGLDLDATLMVTDVAPYANMVQRFGRVNRRGTQRDCRIYWVDRPLIAKWKALARDGELKEKARADVCAPYEVGEVEEAARILSGLKSAAPRDLPKLPDARAPWKHVLRRADILDLFDTSPDLGGNQIDISRFVRSDPDRNVYVAWREWAGDRPVDTDDIEDGELCPAPIGDIEESEVWCWSAIEGRWVRPDKVYPGLTVLMKSSQGKYTREYGWSPESEGVVPPVVHSHGEGEGFDSDTRSFPKYRQTLEAHTQRVCDATQRLIAALENCGIGPYVAELSAAARQHDWGKAHPVMQQTLHGVEGPYVELLAKSEGSGKHSRRHFRHELASALAMVAKGEDDLAAYLAAAHHGRVRVSIRSMPGERDHGRVCVRGIRAGDELLPCGLGDGVARGSEKLNLEPVLLGDGSWAGRALRLRDRLGPFRLAYLEAVLRGADEEGSAKGAE